MNQCHKRSLRTSGNDLFHAPYNAAFQTDLDTMGMRGGFREDVLDDSFRQFSGSLVLFLYDHNTRSRFDIRPGYSVFRFHFFHFKSVLFLGRSGALMSSWISLSLSRTLESIATPCSVKAKGKYLENCPTAIPLLFLVHAAEDSL